MKWYHYIWNYEKIFSGYITIKYFIRFPTWYSGDSRGLRILLSALCLFLGIIAVCSIGEGIINIIFHIVCLLTRVEPSNIIEMTWLDWITPSSVGSRTNLDNQGYLNARSIMNAIHTYERGSGNRRNQK
jgi:hypothetical protein